MLVKRYLMCLTSLLLNCIFLLLFRLGPWGWRASFFSHNAFFFTANLSDHYICLKQRNRGPVENFMDHSLVIKNGSGHENSVAVTPATLVNPQNPVESDFGPAAAYNVMDNTPGPATQTVPMNIPLQNMFTPVGRGDMPTQSLHGSVSDVENIASQPMSHFSHGRPCTTECAVPSNTINEAEELTIESGTVNISSAYSQGLVFITSL